ncbi:leukocyte receptor cluster member 1 [Syngnathoides biaculeatus]|uniref:leukocyte receptor cluster member 1 n=1 Tax=Syngnathoides biaculeatus TaxID=300417 RepID=UPI002ADE7BD8|nr:leukocyte receptor cluster member 1 [Syngnathoides biaculeatus]XP_061676050.1 leukocyte receptor cluster member 1 [Syngnathoides biaculeatus]XP_061676051.1 leukocyte receptor cluster member 1 [Syngnathoides biaculeatus]
MNILPKKSWHVRNKDNVARVRRDEAQAAEEEREAKRRVERAEQEARTEFLRRKARAAVQSEGGGNLEVNNDDQTGASEHLNLFPVEESVEKKDNEEYLKEKKEEKEKQERAIGLLVSLGPQPGTEVTPWYMKTGQEKEEERKEKEKRSEARGDKRKELSEEEREKKDRRLKDSLDPLKEMKKALGGAGTEMHKSKKREKRDKVEKRSTGGSSIERLRAERLQREAEERRRALALLAQRNGKDKESGGELNERERPYNSAYFPELARKRQRRDRDSWRDEILKL